MRDTKREWLEVFTGANLTVSLLLAVTIGLFADNLATGLAVGAGLFGIFIIARALLVSNTHTTHGARQQTI